MLSEITVTINGDEHLLGVKSNETLQDVLRLRLGLTGTKKGCEVGVCGSCTVLLEGEQRGSGVGLGHLLARTGQVTLLGRRVRDEKFQGLSPERVDDLRGEADLVLVEADGARGRSLKVPADHEPVLPASTTLLLVVAAIDVSNRDNPWPRVSLTVAGAGFEDVCTSNDFTIPPDMDDNVFSFFPLGCNMSGPVPIQNSPLPWLLGALLLLFVLRLRRAR